MDEAVNLGKAVHDKRCPVLHSIKIWEQFNAWRCIYFGSQLEKSQYQWRLAILHALDHKYDHCAAEDIKQKMTLELVPPSLMSEKKSFFS